MIFYIKKKFSFTVFFVLLVSCFFVVSVSAVQYCSPNFFVGLADYGTFINFEDSRTFSTVYTTGDSAVFDSYVLSVQNGNLTVNELFDSPNFVKLTVSGVEGTTSLVTLDASAYGYTHEPSSVTLTGDVLNVEDALTDNELVLSAEHVTTGDVVYEVVWSGTTDGTGGSVSSDSTTDTSDTTATDDGSDLIIDGRDDSTKEDTFTVPPEFIIVGCVAVAAVFIYGESEHRKSNSPRKAYRQSKKKPEKPEWDKKKKLWD